MYLPKELFQMTGVFPQSFHLYHIFFQTKSLVKSNLNVHMYGGYCTLSRLTQDRLILLINCV
jgi:hypothetical protein